MTTPDPHDTAAFQARLQVHLQGHGVALPDAVTTAWATHFGLLRRWNRTHNLTRIVDVDDAILKHYLDCALPLLDPAVLGGLPSRPATVVDVGSGAGFPGLVAGMLWQGTGWTGTPWGPPNTPPALVLVEPARKRQSFLQVAAKAVEVSCQVVAPPPPGTLQGAVVLTRATFSGGVRHTLWPYVAVGGALVAWTTPHELSMWHDEVGTWPGARATSHRCEIGGVDRRLAVVRKGPEDG